MVLVLFSTRKLRVLLGKCHYGCERFLYFGIHARELNCTILDLDPKCANLIYCKDFRPISCCNTINKCITKVLANGITRILPNFIKKTQVAFVEVSKISDNILLCK